MKPEAFIAHLEGVYKKCIGVAKKKNADYSGSNADAFRNFDAVEFFGITDSKTGIMVRLTDKFTRIANLLTKDAKVVEESLQDSIEDAINYLAIMHAKLEAEKIKTKK